MGRRRLAGEKGASSGALFLCIGLLAVTAVVPASDNLTGVLPADNQVVLSISDAPALLAFVESLSLTGDLTPEDTSSLLAGLLEPAQMQALQQYLKGLSDLEHLLSSRVTGQMVLAVPETPGLNADPGELQRIILLAETDLDDGKMQEFLSSLLAATGVSPAATEDVDSHGVTLHLLHRSAEKDSRRHPGGWSVVKGVLAVATQREDLEQATQRLQTRSGDSLDSLAAFQAVRARAPDSDLLLFVNFKEIFSGLQKALREMEAASGENEAAEALVSPDLDDRFHLLGLDAMEAAFLSLHLEAHAVRFDYGLLQAENRGLFRLMAFQPVPAVLPPFMPARSTSASMTGFDFGQAWEAINDILYSLEPDLAVLMQSQVKAFESMTDIRLKADLLDELGPLVYTMTLPSEAQEATKTSPGTGTILSGDSSESSRSNSTRSAPPSTRDNQKELPATVFLVQVHDRAAMEKTLAALLTPLGPLEDLFKTEDVEGVALHTANHFFQDTDSMPPSISYAVADHWVMVGAAPGTVMQKILRECLHPDRPLSSRSDLSKALAALPPGAVSITYQDFGIFAQRLKSTLTLLQKNGPTASQQTRTFLPALHSALLQGSFRISVSTMQRTGEGLFGTTRWLNP